MGGPGKQRHELITAQTADHNVTIEEVGNAGAFLCSDLASGISGEIMYVDGGFNTTAMGNIEE
jgi:enoyl-[acyl-carrier-protein] reductase (NADH)